MNKKIVIFACVLSGSAGVINVMHAAAEAVGPVLASNVFENQKPQGAWSVLASWIEQGNFDLVKSIVPSRIQKDQKRNFPGARSHNLTAYDIASFHLQNARNKNNTPLTNKLEQIVAYLKPVDVGLVSVDNQWENENPEGAWSILASWIEQGNLDLVKSIVPSRIQKNQKRNFPGARSHNLTAYDIALFHLQNARKDAKLALASKLEQIVAYLKPEAVAGFGMPAAAAAQGGEAPPPSYQEAMKQKAKEAKGQVLSFEQWQQSEVAPDMLGFLPKVTLQEMYVEYLSMQGKAVLPVAAAGLPGAGAAAEAEAKEEEEKKEQGQGGVAVSFDQLVNASNIFNDTVGEFPLKTNRIATLAGDNVAKKNAIAQQAAAVRPILFARTLPLIKAFLDHKKQFGTAQEKAVYAGMNQQSFINRLLVKRPLEFMNQFDQYLLRNGQEGSGGFEAIGTGAEKAPLVLKEYLSYDEMQIAALLGVSVPTYFINDGDRNNKGVVAYAGKLYQQEGVYVGLVGTRFEKPDVMEWAHMMVTPEQNTPEKGYGPAAVPSSRAQLLKVWAPFYDIPYFPTHSQAQQDKTGRFLQIGKSNRYLDVHVYKQRLKASILPFLFDANNRGLQAGKKVYCHAVGLGIGVWAVSPMLKETQEKYMLEVYDQILKEHTFAHIADIDFSWFFNDSIGGIKDGQSIKNIKVHFSKRNPAAKLVGADAAKLLVAMYAWDSNAYPGNEYWTGSLAASGDPAAVSSSTLAELQNPLINPAVSSKNLFVAPE